MTVKAYNVGFAGQMRVSPGFLRQIDDWRRKEPDMPSRAEAIRRLVAIGLTAPKRKGSATVP
jgi:hypothetical protein